METYDANFIPSVGITNFKSLKSVRLDDCRRINVLIGRPNVGKSNILEALALFDVPYMLYSSARSLRNLVRVENVSDLFYNGVTTSLAAIDAGNGSLTVGRSINNGLTVSIVSGTDTSAFTFSPALALTTKKEPASLPSILAYFFQKHVAPESAGVDFLLPPSGANLMETVAANPELKANLANLFHAYGLKMMFDAGSRQIKAVRENGLDMFLVPFGSLADSLQRLIFYKAAIAGNSGKVICFEEPEAHTYPPYIANIVDDVIASRSNQFFITTHSPYVMNALLESAGSDLAVYVVDMVDNATAVKRLSDSDLQTAYDNGMDLFFNIEAFLDR